MADFLDKVAAALNWLLPKQTGYVAPPPLAFETHLGLTLDYDNQIKGVFPDKSLPERQNYSTNNQVIRDVILHANVGAEPGMRVVVVYDSGMGLVAYRATVKEKKR